MKESGFLFKSFILILAGNVIEHDTNTHTHLC